MRFVRVAGAICLMLLLCTLSACLHFQSEDIQSQNVSGPPDKILFERASCAIEEQKYDVARLTLETLANTYPDSEYATKAQELLHNPRLDCGSSWSVSSSDCNAYSNTGGGMTFFPN